MLKPRRTGGCSKSLCPPKPNTSVDMFTQNHVFTHNSITIAFAVAPGSHESSISSLAACGVGTLGSWCQDVRKRLQDHQNAGSNCTPKSTSKEPVCPCKPHLLPWPCACHNLIEDCSWDRGLQTPETKLQRFKRKRNTSNLSYV